MDHLFNAVPTFITSLGISKPKLVRDLITIIKVVHLNKTSMHIGLQNHGCGVLRSNHKN